MSQRDVFLKCIEDEPLNQGYRDVYSDWLLEQDEPEECERQRQFIGALNILRRHTDFRYLLDEGNGEWKTTITKEEYKHLIAEIDNWKVSVESGHGIRFGNTSSSDEITGDARTRHEFWKAFRIVTGVEAPDDIKFREYYGCGC